MTRLEIVVQLLRSTNVLADQRSLDANLKLAKTIEAETDKRYRDDSIEAAFNLADYLIKAEEDRIRKDNFPNL